MIISDTNVKIYLRIKGREEEINLLLAPLCTCIILPPPPPPMRGRGNGIQNNEIFSISTVQVGKEISKGWVERNSNRLENKYTPLNYKRKKVRCIK